ncbi:MAG TPA: hypothetical protein VJ900_00505 [Patescibacteria group bacterium]|nr:hypothetical protein [Patescibacteria group bacterium]HKL16835.1 hypothetical protein [Patescibacteria group bacterium]
MKKQKMKNVLLLSLLFLSGLLVALSITSIILIIAVSFQSTIPGNSFLEEVARFAFLNPILSLFLTIISVIFLVLLKKPFKNLLKRNKIEKKLNEFFSD